MTKKAKEEHRPAEEHKKPGTDLEKQLEETKAKLLRALADFDNFRKRAAVEKEELTRYSNEKMLAELLPYSTEKAAVSAKSSSGEELEKGLALVLKQMKDALAMFGVAEITAVGKKFDPNFHEAILIQDSEVEPGTVIAEIQKAIRSTAGCSGRRW